MQWAIDNNDTEAIDRFKSKYNMSIDAVLDMLE